MYNHSSPGSLPDAKEGGEGAQFKQIPGGLIVASLVEHQASSHLELLDKP